MAKATLATDCSVGWGTGLRCWTSAHSCACSCYEGTLCVLWPQNLAGAKGQLSPSMGQGGSGDKGGERQPDPQTQLLFFALCLWWCYFCPWQSVLLLIKESEKRRKME
jgi:hypothetical protein